MGGLGVMDLAMFNEALLMKWLWQWIEPKQRLWKTIFKITNGLQRPYPNSYFFNKTLKGVYSKFIISMIRVPGDGSTIRFWMENWGLGLLCQDYPNLYTYALDNETTLQKVFNSGHFQNCFIHNLSEEATSEMINLENAITTSMVQLSQTEDGIKWRWTEGGIFTVKSAYQAIMNRSSRKETVHRIWKLKAPPRFKVFAWLLCFKKILTVDNLNRRGWSLTNRCIMCKVQSESVSHLFNECVQAKLLYRIIELRMKVKIPGGISYGNENTVVSLKESKFSKKEKSILLITQFVIWRERCSRTFREEYCNLLQLAQQVEAQWRYSSLTGAQQE